MMSDANGSGQTNKQNEARGIAGLTVAGFKSISEPRTIEIRPLTILAGANSSGKSSIMQPLLLLKQTLESTYKVPVLKLDGPIVNFTLIDQFFSKQSEVFELEVVDNRFRAKTGLGRDSKRSGLEIKYSTYNFSGQTRTYKPNMTSNEILSPMVEYPPVKMNELQLFINTSNCFLYPDVKVIDTKNWNYPYAFGVLEGDGFEFAVILNDLQWLLDDVQKIIYLTGSRGKPERVYPITAVGRTFPGIFEPYTASVILDWQQNKPDKIESLANDLAFLEVGTGAVKVVRVGDVGIELQVSRLKPNGHKRNGKNDFVSLADVGLGVSHTLPVLVALQAAQPGQLVYIEQPELHLHPKAQVAMAHILANAAKRGVRVVLETHSDLLLIGIQTLVAEGELDPNLVKLHWFSRDKNGVTQIDSADMDRKGAFGDWPEDFGQISLDTQSRYLDAVTRYRQQEKENNARKNLEKSSLSH